MVLPRLMRSSSRRAFDCEALRPREIDRRHRRLVARLVVVERLLRQQLPLDTGCATARRWSAASLQIGLALADGRLRDLLGRLGLLDLFLDLEVLDLGDALAAAHAIAEAHVDVLEPARGARRHRHGGLADQVADDGDLRLRSRRALALREFHGQRRPAELSAAEAAGHRRRRRPPRPPAARGACRPAPPAARPAVWLSRSTAAAEIASRRPPRRRPRPPPMTIFFMTVNNDHPLRERRQRRRRRQFPRSNRGDAGPPRSPALPARGRSPRGRGDSRAARAVRCSARSPGRAAPGRRRSWWTGPPRSGSARPTAASRASSRATSAAS